jgi:hypothetical protein
MRTRTLTTIARMHEIDSWVSTVYDMFGTQVISTSLSVYSNSANTFLCMAVINLDNTTPPEPKPARNKIHIG